MYFENNIFAQMGFISTESEDHTSSSDIQDELPVVVPTDVEEGFVDKLHDSVGGPQNEERLNEDLPADDMPDELQQELDEIEKTGEIDKWVGTDVMEIEKEGNPETLNGGVPAGPVEDEPTVPIIEELEEAGEINKTEFLDNSFGENNEVNDVMMEQLDQEERTEDMGLSAPVETEVLTEKNTDFVVQSAEPNSVKDSFTEDLDEKESESKPEIIDTEVKEEEIKGDESSALDPADDVKEEVKTSVASESEDVDTDEDEDSNEEEEKEEAPSEDDEECDDCEEESEKEDEEQESKEEKSEVEKEIEFIESITIDAVIDGDKGDLEEAEENAEKIELDGSSAFDETPNMVSVNTEEGQQEFPDEVVPEGTEIIEPEEKKEETVADIIQDTAEEDTKESHSPVDEPVAEYIEEEQKEVQEEVASESIAERMRKTILSWF